MTRPARRPERRLAQLARLPIRPLRLRLVDAVTMAAAGLLLLKLIAILGETSPQPSEPLPDFARVLAKARTGYEPPDPTTTGSVGAKEAKAEAKPPEPPVYQPDIPDTVSASERAILEKLAARRDARRQRSDALDMREQVLGAAEKKLEAGVAGLGESEARADLGGAKRVEAERAGMKSIVTMYETMKPKDAARVFDRLALDVLVPIVLAMNPRKMAEILAVMGPEPAEKLTVALASRARGVDLPPAQQANAALPPNELPALDPGPPTRSAVP